MRLAGIKLLAIVFIIISCTELTVRAQEEGSDSSSMAYKYYNEALRLENAGDLHDAVATYRLAIGHNPRIKEFHHQLAKLLARTGQVQSAMSEFRTALNIDYNYVECRNNYGSFLRRTDQLKDAENEFRQCIQIDPKFPYPYYNLGRMLKEKGDLDGAIENFEHATNLKPDYAEAQEALGMAIFERAAQGDLSTAAEKLQVAAKLVPKNPLIHYHLGLIYATKSDLDAAESQFREALMCDPRLAAAHYELAKLRYFRGDLDRCLSEIKQAEAINPTYTTNQEYPHLDLIQVRTLEAHAYENMGDPVHALEDYQKLVAMRKSDVLYAEHIKTLQRDIKKLLARSKKKGKEPAYDPEEVDAFISKGINAYEDGDLDSARAAFERGLELNPQSFRCMQNLTFIQEAQGDLNTALASQQKAISMNPQYDGAVYNLAYLLEKANLADEAARTYEKFRSMANAYPYDPQHITELQQNIIRQKKKEEVLRKRGF